HHMQVYWYKTRHEGRLGMLPIIHVREIDRWVSRRSGFLEPPSEMRDEGGRWNIGCINCHATHGETRNENALEFDSQVAELGIACEACHGPAEKHITIHQNPVTRYARRRDIEPDQTIVEPSRVDPQRSTEVCGQCHSASFPRSLEHQHSYRPGKVLAEFRDQLDPAKPESFKGDAASMEFSFWSDGMIRVAGREYNGLARTPCYTHGDKSKTISCLSCHELHPQSDDQRDPLAWADDQLKPSMRGNIACTQCHEEMADTATLQKHTHHAPNSHGSSCYNCHMPHTTYGLLKGTRSHTIDSPNVASTLATGRINACNQCHIDQSLGWTAKHLQTWYGIESPPIDKERNETSEVVFQALTGDAGQRALIAWTLGWKPAHEAGDNDWIGPYLAQLLDDPYDAVRFIAHRSIQRLPAFDEFEYDYIAAPEKRKARSESALSNWERSSARPSKTILINQDGELEKERFAELLERRDDKPMYLIE
ncbi:MAG: cytochrome c3 family protein, partial [Limisphaerales bacterium]